MQAPEDPHNTIPIFNHRIFISQPIQPLKGKVLATIGIVNADRVGTRNMLFDLCKEGPVFVKLMHSISNRKMHNLICQTL